MQLVFNMPKMSQSLEPVSIFCALHEILKSIIFQLIVGYFEASVVTCILRFWFREIGFSISYGALLLKTWR